MVQIIKKPKKLVTIIKREAWEEQQGVQKLEADTQQQRAQIIAAAKEQATLAKEQAMQAGEVGAFAEAAHVAVNMFIDRAKLCLDLKSAMERLVSEIAQKILGAPLSLDQSKQSAVINQGIAKMRSRHKLKIQLAHPEQLASIAQMPDFEIEAASDVPKNLVRVVTEVGSALWAESEALAVLKADDTVHLG